MRKMTAAEKYAVSDVDVDQIKKVGTLLKMFDIRSDVVTIRGRQTTFRLVYLKTTPNGNFAFCTLDCKSVKALAKNVHQLIRQKQEQAGVL